MEISINSNILKSWRNTLGSCIEINSMRRTTMTTRAAGASLIALAIGLGFSSAMAAEATQRPDTAQAQEPIYGSQLMTRDERTEHRNKMRSLKTPEEREAYRAEHHRQMQERAKERGVTLPDAPPARGMGMGPGGPGMRQGMGPGGPNR
jgi:hypothetical protein